MARDDRQEDAGRRDLTGDSLDLGAQRRVFDRDAIGWLAGQGIRYLHAANADEEASFKRVVELLERMPDATRVIAQLFHEAPREDYALRWSFLYLLAEMGHPAADDVFYRVAVEPVPPPERYGQGCETPRDGELLVRTMAIAGLGRIASKDPRIAELLYRVIAEQPERALRIEAVKALIAIDRAAADRIKEILPEELHFAIDLKRVGAESLAVEHEVAKVDTVRRAPDLGTKRSAPKASPCNGE